MIAMAAATVVQRLAGGTPHSILRRPDCTQILHHNGTRPPRRLPLKPVFLNCPRRRHGSCKAASIVLQTSPGWSLMHRYPPLWILLWKSDHNSIVHSP